MVNDSSKDTIYREHLLEIRSKIESHMLFSHEEEGLSPVLASNIESLKNEIKECLDTITNEASLLRLKQKAWTTDIPCVRLLANERLLRKGVYPYYVRGFEQDRIDDYSLESSALLVGACGNVKTREGKLVVVQAVAQSTPSDLFHAIFATEEDQKYLYQILRHIDPVGLIEGTSAVKTISLEKLNALVIPWMEKSGRDQFVEVMEKLDSLYRNNLHEESAENLCEMRNLLAAYLCTFNSIPSLLAKLIDVERTNRAPHSKNPALPSSSEHKTNDAHFAVRMEPEGIFEVIEGILDVGQARIQERELFDVVAATFDLAAGSLGIKEKTVICFPPPNQGEWTSFVNSADSRWVLGTPPRNKANYAWIQQTIDCMEDNSTALLLLCNAPLHSSIGAEQKLRENLAQSGLVQCVISFPGKVFPDNRPPTSLVVLEKGRQQTDVLFINAQSLGKTIFAGCELTEQENRQTIDTAKNCCAIGRSLPQETVTNILEIYRAWISGLPIPNNNLYRVATLEEVGNHDNVLSIQLHGN